MRVSIRQFLSVVALVMLVIMTSTAVAQIWNDMAREILATVEAFVNAQKALSRADFKSLKPEDRAALKSDLDLLALSLEKLSASQTLLLDALKTQVKRIREETGNDEANRQFWTTSVLQHAVNVQNAVRAAGDILRKQKHIDLVLSANERFALGDHFAMKGRETLKFEQLPIPLNSKDAELLESPIEAYEVLTSRLSALREVLERRRREL
jgi:hypothetical protein